VAEGIGLLNQRIVFYTMGSNPIPSTILTTKYSVHCVYSLVCYE
jgi:hypothetical protein